MDRLDQKRSISVQKLGAARISLLALHSNGGQARFRSSEERHRYVVGTKLPHGRRHTFLSLGKYVGRKGESRQDANKIREPDHEGNRPSPRIRPAESHSCVADCPSRKQSVEGRGDKV